MPVVRWGADLMQSCSLLLWPQLSTLTRQQKKRKKNIGRGGGAQKQLRFVTYMHIMVTKLQLYQLSYGGSYFKA